ncbi:MAG TPA: zinc-ribbon domain-containing protein [Ktedonobacteraceae bacterium]|nr:zinc-ribbon domain-containing protein [Ktedonobacteraceae bacterium]
MTQSITHSCANCGNSVPENMRFCPNCGTLAGIPQAPPPPPVDSYGPTQKGTPFTAYPQQNHQSAYQPPPAQQGYQPPFQSAQPPPAYARPQKNSSRGMLKVAAILLLLILVLGAAGYFALHALTSRGGNTARTGATSGTTPTQAALTTTPINTIVNYASVNITILNAQQATSFADDTGTLAQGVVRLNLHAVQSDVTSMDFTSAPTYAYGESFALLLPGGNKMAIGGYKDISGPARQGDQTTWIDFSASTSLKVNQMILLIGRDTEEQLQVPLTGHADVSQYQPKQSAPNLRVPFGSMFWTLKTVTFKLSDSGTQVDKGKRFLVLTFSLDNPGTEGYNAFPPDFMRLQYGGTTIALEQAAIGDAAAGTTNVLGLVSFLVPQDTTTATFILLPGHTPGATTQATIPFQIP